MSATVRGIVAMSNHQPVEFREQGSGQVVTTMPNPIDGAFSLHLPEGRYDVPQGSVHTNLTVLPGGCDLIDLRPEHFLDFKVSFQDFGQNELWCECLRKELVSTCFRFEAIISPCESKQP